MKKKKTFIKNTLILTVTALILRTIGLFFRVYLSNIIGAEGIGLYQLIFSVYMLAATYATSGISTAVTRLCADEMVCGTKSSVMKVLKRSIQLSVCAGVILNTIVFFGSDVISNIFIGDARAARSLTILSFSLVPMGISACFKGYFMARRKALRPSVANVVEQVIRIGVVMLLLIKFAHLGIETSCFVVLLSDTVAETASCIFIYFSFIRERKTLVIKNEVCCKKKRVTPAILKIAIPITAGKYLTSFLHTAENLIVPKCLTSFSGSHSSGIEIFGLLKGMALPILFFPSSFLMSVSSLLIPEISESAALNNQTAIRRDVERTIGITIIGATLVAGWFYLCSHEISMVLYHNSEVGVLINVLAPLIPLMYLESVVDGILKGLDQQNASLLYSTIDSCLRIGLILIFVPKFGIDCFILIMFFSNILTCSLNFIKLLRVTVLKFDIKNWLLKPFAAILIAVTFAKFICVGIENDILYIAFGILIISLIYIGLISITGAVDISTIIQYRKSKKKERV